MGSRAGALGAIAVGQATASRRARAGPITVLHVLSPMAPGETGGADEHLADLVECQLRSARLRPVVLALGSKGYSERMAAIGVASVDTNPLRGTALRALAGVVARFGVSVIHTHGYDGDFLTAHARARGLTDGAVVVATVHGLVTRPARNLVKTAANLACLPAMNGLIVTASRDLYRPWPLPRGRRFFVPNGIDLPDERTGRRPRLRQTLALPPEAPVVGFCGRLALEKRPDLFVRAAAALARRHPDACFVAIGTGDELGRLERLAAALELDHRLIFAGFRSDAVELVGGFDALLCPSDQEGTPRAVLEAMAQRVPVIATRVGGLPDIVRDGVDGLLVPRRDVEALVSAGDALLCDATLRVSLGAAAAERVRRHFTRETMAERVEDVYRRLLTGQRYKRRSTT